MEPVRDAVKRPQLCLHLAGGTRADLRSLEAAFGDGERWFGVAPDAWQAAGLSGARSRRLARIRDGPEAHRPEQEQALCRRRGIRLVGWAAEDYPERLDRLPDPPLLIGVLGRWPPPSRALAVVGSRAATPYGRATTRRLAGMAAAGGLAIVSGLARGIDRAAHDATLDHDGWPIAVLGSGLDVPYPPEHAELQCRIAERGTVISEFPLGMAPSRYAFPRRNRIIAALSQAVLVVEAGRRSGALITAEHALDLGIDVLAVPGPIDARVSEGTNRLIADGAPPVLDETGLAELLQLADPASPARETDPLLLALGRRALAADELGRLLQQSAAHVRRLLTTLELSGRVRRVAGGRWEAVAARARAPRRSGG